MKSVNLHLKRVNGNSSRFEVHSKSRPITESKLFGTAMFQNLHLTGITDDVS